MDEEGFRKHLKRGGRSPNAVERCLRYTTEFQRYLDEHPGNADLGEADGQDLESFVAWLERKPKASAKAHLWALRYYYDFTQNGDMSRIAAALRQQRIRRTAFALAGFRGVGPGHVSKLEELGIRNVDQMLKAGRTQADRKALSTKTGIPVGKILEIVLLSDLARIPGIRGVRARLFYDAGVDTVAEMARWDPEELGALLTAFVEQGDFDGIAPLPKEIAFSVATARQLPAIVDY